MRVRISLLAFVLALPVAALPACVQAQASSEPNANKTSFEFFDASVNAMKADRLEDAGFLFYAGQLRYRYEVAAFPPDNEGDEAQSIYQISYEIGATLNPALFREPTVLARVLERYGAWTPSMGPGTKPLWASMHPAPHAKAEAEMVTRKAAFSHHLHDLVTLLLDPEYFKNFRIMQDCNMAPAAQRPTAAQCTAAKARAKAIAKSKNLDDLN